MRLSTLSALALPFLASAQESPLDQVQHYLNIITSYIPSPNKGHSPEPAPPAGGRGLNILTLDNWDATIRSKTLPEEWWILVTGGNKTCWGRCDTVEKAFNATAASWSLDPTTPNLAYLNCDNQPVLCNAWGAGAPCMWFVDVHSPTGAVDIRTKGLNSTTTTEETLKELWESKSYKDTPIYEGVFNPFTGKLAQLGLAVPAGYLFWFLAVVPSWMFMIGISFVSRSIMSRRAAAPNTNTRGPRPAAPAGPGAKARKNK